MARSRKTTDYIMLKLMASLNDGDLNNIGEWKLPVDELENLSIKIELLAAEIRAEIQKG